MSETILGVTANIERDLYTRVRTNFNLAFDADASSPIYNVWRKICFATKTTGKTDRYPFSLPLNDMEEWTDERKFEDLEYDDFSLSNTDFEKSIKIHRNEIEDDALGMAMGRARELGQVAARHPQIRMTALINEHMTGTAGTYIVGFDGVTLFNTAHTWQSGYTTSQDNLRGSATAHQGKMDTTYGLANLQGAWTTLSSGFKNHQQRVMTQVPTVCVVSSSVYFAAAEYLHSRDLAYTTTATVTTRGTKNIINRLGIELLHDPHLTTGYWYLAATGDAFGRPVLWQERQGARLAAQDTNASDSVFLRNEYRYGVDTRDAIAPMFWFKIVGGDAT